MTKPFLATLFAATLCILPGSANADSCSDVHQVGEDKRGMGPAHHPIGRALPNSDAFHAPQTCTDGVWFFDQNRNGRADDEEVRLFGARQVIDCGSCHGQSALAKSAAAASVFLRQDAATLCLVCHRM